ncbi:MAG: hypothetical protein ABEK59_01290 [Halobacteria archaeon]
MTLEGGWMPQTEEEESLLEDIHVVTRLAHQKGVSKKRISALLAFMASATLDPRAEDRETKPPADDEDAATLEDAMSQEAEKPTCPVCCETVHDITTGMGFQTAKLHPCGHELDKEEPIKQIYDALHGGEK